MRYAEKYKREGRGEEKNEGRKVSMRETRRKKKQKGRKNIEEPCIEQLMSIARGFIPCSSTLFSLLAHTLLLLLLLLLRLLLFVGLRLAADHSYQHNYKLGCRLCVSLTSPHPSRRNTRSLSRPGEIFVFVFFSFLHLFYLLLFFFLFFLLVVFFSFVFLPIVDSFYLVSASQRLQIFLGTSRVFTESFQLKN